MPPYATSFTTASGTDEMSMVFSRPARSRKAWMIPRQLVKR